MDVYALKAQLRDVCVELKETRKELERVRMKLEIRMGLQDCLYCEIEMKPKHWEECPDYIKPQQVEKPFAFLEVEEQFQDLHHLHQTSSILE